MKTISRKWIITLLLITNGLYATSHCYKQRSNCFEVEDGSEQIQMYIKRDRFIEVAKAHGLPKEKIEKMIKKGEGRKDEEPKDNRKNSNDYDSGTYRPYPVYVYPPYYWHDHPPHHHPNRH